MSTLQDEVIELAKSAQGIMTDDQIKEIVEFAPRMTEEQLQNMKKLIIQLSQQTVEATQADLELWQAIAEQSKDGKRKESAEQEVKEREDEIKKAEELLSKLK
ncbi:hypothetical protein KKC94_00680 [Patescibacteria group bacterium]|nr:hypothetical protein [Patescibacteria group bacterium]